MVWDLTDSVPFYSSSSFPNSQKRFKISNRIVFLETGRREGRPNRAREWRRRDRGRLAGRGSWIGDRTVWPSSPGKLDLHRRSPSLRLPLLLLLIWEEEKWKNRCPSPKEFDPTLMTHYAKDKARMFSKSGRLLGFFRFIIREFKKGWLSPLEFAPALADFESLSIVDWVRFYPEVAHNFQLIDEQQQKEGKPSMSFHVLMGAHVSSFVKKKHHFHPARCHIASGFELPTYEPSSISVRDTIDRRASIETEKSIESVTTIQRNDGQIQPITVHGSRNQVINSEPQRVKRQLYEYEMFTAKRISSSVAASENIRVLCATLIALMVVLSHHGFPFGIGSIISFRPIFLIALTDVTLVVGMLFTTKWEEKNETYAGTAGQDSRDWTNQIGTALETALASQKVATALFLDCSLCAVIIVCGTSFNKKNI